MHTMVIKHKEKELSIDLNIYTVIVQHWYRKAHTHITKLSN